MEANHENNEIKSTTNFFYVYGISMGFFPYSTDKRQLEVTPITFLEGIAKYSIRQ